MSESAIARLAGASRASANRWARGTHRPDYDPIRRLAGRVYARFPDVARELVEASGYAWAEPQEIPEAADLLAEAWGADTAERVRAEVRKRAPQQAEAILRGIEDIIRSSEERTPPSERAAGLGPLWP